MGELPLHTKSLNNKRTLYTQEKRVEISIEKNGIDETIYIWVGNHKIEFHLADLPATGEELCYITRFGSLCVNQEKFFLRVRVIIDKLPFGCRMTLFRCRLFSAFTALPRLIFRGFSAHWADRYGRSMGSALRFLFGGSLVPVQIVIRIPVSTLPFEPSAVLVAGKPELDSQWWIQVPREFLAGASKSSGKAAFAAGEGSAPYDYRDLEEKDEADRTQRENRMRLAFFLPMALQATMLAVFFFAALFFGFTLGCILALTVFALAAFGLWSLCAYCHRQMKREQR